MVSGLSLQDVPMPRREIVVSISEVSRFLTLLFQHTVKSLKMAAEEQTKQKIAQEGHWSDYLDTF